MAHGGELEEVRWALRTRPLGIFPIVSVLKRMIGS